MNATTDTGNPSRFFVAGLVRAYYAKHGRGMTRRELADEIGWEQTQNLPGVRGAIDEGLIRYDGGRENRLVPGNYRDAVR